MIDSGVLKRVPPDTLDLIAEHSLPSWELEQEEIISFSEDFEGLYTLGGFVCSEYLDDGQDEAIAQALNSGSDRLVLSLIHWLKSPQAKAVPGVPATLTWLGQLDPNGVVNSIRDVVENTLLDDDYDPLSVIKDELADYETFAAIMETVEASRIGEGSSLKEAEAERLGAGLAGLAIKRSLEIVEAAEIEALNALLDL